MTADYSLGRTTTELCLWCLVPTNLIEGLCPRCAATEAVVEAARACVKASPTYVPAEPAWARLVRAVVKFDRLREGSK